jgi:hypothetical protein
MRDCRCRHSSSARTRCKPLSAEQKSGQEVAKQESGVIVFGKQKTPELALVQRLKVGCPGWDRTSDQVINSHLLYR